MELSAADELPAPPGGHWTDWTSVAADFDEGADLMTAELALAVRPGTGIDLVAAEVPVCEVAGPDGNRDGGFSSEIRRRIYFHCTEAFSVLEMFQDDTLYKFTYLLTKRTRIITQRFIRCRNAAGITTGTPNNVETCCAAV